MGSQQTSQQQLLTEEKLNRKDRLTANVRLLLSALQIGLPVGRLQATKRTWTSGCLRLRGGGPECQQVGLSRHGSMLNKRPLTRGSHPESGGSAIGSEADDHRAGQPISVHDNPWPSGDFQPL